MTTLHTTTTCSPSASTPQRSLPAHGGSAYRNPTHGGPTHDDPTQRNPTRGNPTHRSSRCSTRHNYRHTLMYSIPANIVYDNDVGGQLSLLALENRGVIVRLTAECGYLVQAQEHVQSRADIVAHLIPASAVASSNLAYWVWMGGNFPACFDIITPSHYRDTLYGRPVHARNRVLESTQITITNHLRLTTPLRTACDMSCTTLTHPHKYQDPMMLCAPSATEYEHYTLNEARILTQMRALIHTYNIPIDACVSTLHTNTHWPNRLLGLQRWEQINTPSIH